MKREIKFRGKSLSKWIYGGWFTNSDEDCLKTYIFDRIYGSIEIDKTTVGQFTGLKDKNGVDIYDGDIIKTERNIVEVFFGKRTFKVIIYGKKDEIEVNGWLIKNKKGETDVLDSSFCEGEIIGNIHENPELLK